MYLQTSSLDVKFLQRMKPPLERVSFPTFAGFIPQQTSWRDQLEVQGKLTSSQLLSLSERSHCSPVIRPLLITTVRNGSTPTPVFTHGHAQTTQYPLHRHLPEFVAAGRTSWSHVCSAAWEKQLETGALPLNKSLLTKIVLCEIL
ncbi:hypothetical protein RRG08_009516 [Elysia crispata]|uniref:Uncharacterized protein n=1 Tax=Elysia crispata TaxID=231223 RepID=A0AAE1E8F8_9GAST|nr:hypothetical protein RRG08_009516 [Elysia crispata]